MSDLQCPYCEESLSDPDDCYEEDEVYEHQCRNCEKHFAFSLSYSRYYDAWKADCLNGAEHDWKEISAWPPEVYANKRRCSVCDRMKTINNKGAASHE